MAFGCRKFETTELELHCPEKNKRVGKGDKKPKSRSYNSSWGWSSDHKAIGQTHDEKEQARVLGNPKL